MKHLGTCHDAMYCGSYKNEKDGMQTCLQREGGKSELGVLLTKPYMCIISKKLNEW
jgi:hypothetical protein